MPEKNAGGADQKFDEKIFIVVGLSRITQTSGTETAEFLLYANQEINPANLYPSEIHDRLVNK